MSTKGNVGKEENVQTDDTASRSDTSGFMFQGEEEGDNAFEKNKAVFLQQQRQCIEDLRRFQADMMKEMKHDISFLRSHRKES